MSRRNSGQSQDVYERTNLLYSCEYVRDHQLLADLMKVLPLLDWGGGVAGGRGVKRGSGKREITMKGKGGAV